jgi:Tfp pilus assembly protein PilX
MRHQAESEEFKKWEPSAVCRCLGNQRGVALVLALTMLAVMSILGALALSTSTSEIGISGNYRTAKEAFFAAERAVEYGYTNAEIFDRPTTAFPVALTGDYATHIAVGNSGLKSGEINQVDYLTSGALPPGTGSDPTIFQARYYIVTVTAQGPRNSTVRVESQVSRIVPK